MYCIPSWALLGILKSSIVNEHIKSTINICLPIYCKLFNIVLNSVFIPESWSEGVIFPIYKNKGDTKDPRLYR
jgi:hypothetical protein